MASSLVSSSRNMKRTESMRSHSWWWDSHISPKNSKWLAENLDEMDRSVKRMLKLIEEDGDSFAKKAEMYYQTRPELISHVEEFYRMYRSLAERYDQLMGELRRNVPSELQSQGSGMSDFSSDQSSPLLTPNQRLVRRTSGLRAPGFEFFLGSGEGSSDLSQKEAGKSSSLSDSDSESDDSSINNYWGPPVNNDGEGLHMKITELDVELRNVKEMLRVAEEENAGGMVKVTENDNYKALLGRITWYEEELKVANEKLQLSGEEIARFKLELEKNTSLELISNLHAQLESAKKDIKMREAELELEKNRVLELQDQITGSEIDVSDPGCKTEAFVEELRIAKERLQDSEKEIVKVKHELEKNESFQVQLELAQREIATGKAELEIGKRQVSELQEWIVGYKDNVVECDREIGELKAAIFEANQNFFLEKSQLQSEISSLSDKQTLLEANLKKWELKGQFLEEEMGRIEAEKMKMHGLHVAQIGGLQGEIERLKAEVAVRGDRVEEMNKRLDTLKLKHDMVMAERDELNAKLLKVAADLSGREDQIRGMDEHLQRLHMEHVELIAGSELGQKQVEELRGRVKELENEVERLRVVISDGAEEKREAIRQLCFSLEHYRDGYHQLRQAYIGHKRHAVLAS